MNLNIKRIVVILLHIFWVFSWVYSIAMTYTVDYQDIHLFFGGSVYVLIIAPCITIALEFLLYFIPSFKTLEEKKKYRIFCMTVTGIVYGLFACMHLDILL